MTAQQDIERRLTEVQAEERRERDRAADREAALDSRIAQAVQDSKRLAHTAG